MSLADIAQGYLDGALKRSQRVRSERRPVLAQVARLVGARIPRWRQVRGAVLTVGGLGAIDYAVWDGAGRIWGSASIGVTLLVLEWLSGDDRDRR
jgi:hypothetical protein